MDYRSVMAGVLILGAGSIALTSSCSAPDPGQVTFSERVHQGSEPSGPTGDAGDPASSSGNTDSGTEGGTTTPVDAFTGDGAYAAGAANGTSNQPANHPNAGNPAGVDCTTCHKMGGAAGAWGICGTVYTDKAGATVAPAGVEVRLVDSKGTELAKVYTDALGNFWSDAIVGGIPAGSHVGIRNASGPLKMATLLGSNATDGGCQNANCHVSGKQGRVSLTP